MLNLDTCQDIQFALSVYLSDTEADLLKCLALGLSNSEISERMSLSTRTIKNYISFLLEKLNAPNRTYAAVVALKSGLVDYPDDLPEIARVQSKDEELGQRLNRIEQRLDMIESQLISHDYKRD